MALRRLRLALVRRAGEIFKGIVLEQVYGSTEGAGGWYTKLSHADHQWALKNDENLLSSCGQPMIHCRVRIVGEEGQILPPGEVGEISVSGDFVMDGYLKEPEMTDKVLKDGWLLTGDMGRLDEKGYLYLVDRKQFMMITGGYNVYPIEVENVIAAHPAVLEVCALWPAGRQMGRERSMQRLCHASVRPSTRMSFASGAEARCRNSRSPRRLKFAIN